jgi:hypothetical protein
LPVFVVSENFQIYEELGLLSSFLFLFIFKNILKIYGKMQRNTPSASRHPSLKRGEFCWFLSFDVFGVTRDSHFLGGWCVLI